ncbi:PLP-dependent aminotransferase family protein [Paenibacillus sp. GCM10012307]|uniref:PLP-dependent aminotransferase family protein n=1 Tax=Paenibacillus roseus TaxID=2798579 RepID=A0A934MLY1_9BACL|nr:PLP-dependent aminotransferase family protein [Paenibacillus roseus]MBJ6362710.1 PLP-dependent aminotransferase family protein [Paenibacillus roseus]
MTKYMMLLADLETWIDHAKQGDKLPSIRLLARQYNYSHSTIIRALQELEQRHLVYSIPKSGFFVVKNTKDVKEKQSSLLDFVSASPDPDIFPYVDFQHCMNKAIDTYRSELFIYGMPHGLPALIQVIQKQLMSYQVFVNTRQIIITSGVQQALSILSELEFPSGKQKVLVEQPGYHLLMELLETRGIPVAGINRTAKGIDLDELEQLFRTGNIKFFYTIPRFHNPLGSSYDEETKQKIAELAERYDVYIVEDDYMGDFEQNSKSDPIYAYSRASRVIYLKSYSKIIFPGLRVGAAILPESLVEAFTRYKRILDIDSAAMSQAALEIYIKSGMFARHRARVISSYAEKALVLDSALKHLAELHPELVAYIPPAQPMILNHFLLKKRALTGKLISALKQKSILLGSMEPHYLHSFEQLPIVKLNVSQLNINQIQAGMEQLSLIISRMRD